MQRSVSEPLLNLADTARRVSTTRDYSLRAAAPTRDEIGVVVRSFNEMLDQIAERTPSSRRPTPNCSTRSRSANASSAIASWRWNERDANRLKDEFLATSHELRTPMNAVLGWARVLRSTAADEPTRERGLESIERNARAGTVDRGSPRNLAHCHGQAAPVREVDLAAIVDTAVDIVKPAALAKRLRLDASIEMRPPLTPRSRSPAAGDLEPALERRQVHAAGRPGQCPAGAENGVVLTVQDSGFGIEPKFCRTCSTRSGRRTAAPRASTVAWASAWPSPSARRGAGTIEARSAGKDRGRYSKSFCRP